MQHFAHISVGFVSAKKYEIPYFEEANREYNFSIDYIEHRLTAETAQILTSYPVLCAFVHDDLSVKTIEVLRKGKTRLIALRCAGFNNVDILAADNAGIVVCNVPNYSPHAVAEHTVGLMLCLNRKYHRSYWRVREGNFALDGLLGFDMAGKTVGIIGTGRIGSVVARILLGMGCAVIAYDPVPSEDCKSMGVRYITFDELIEQSDIITIHCPLTPETRHLINAGTIARMKDGVMLINTSRGAIIDTAALIDGLKKGKFRGVGLDVYEEEEQYFYKDLSEQIIQDDLLARLLTFPNVLITAHQGFFTHEALRKIAMTTLQNIAEFITTGSCSNALTPQRVIP